MSTELARRSDARRASRHGRIDYSAPIAGQPPSKLPPTKPQPRPPVRRVRDALGTIIDRRRVPGTPLVSYSARDAHGVPIDLRLLHFLDRRGGFFVEAGANDGIVQSNTALLERSFGWEGILVEPSPDAAALCRRNRAAPVHNVALVPFDYDGETVVGDFDGHPMGSIGGARLQRGEAISVPASTLQAILDEHDIRHVDFLSLDTEGHELQVLRGCDLARTTFDYMLIELYEANYADTVAFLEQAGYALIGNYSGYNTHENPEWDGTHNDFLFRRRGLEQAA